MPVRDLVDTVGRLLPHPNGGHRPRRPATIRLSPMRRLVVGLGLTGFLGLLIVAAGDLWIRSRLEAGLTRHFGRRWEYSRLSFRVSPPGLTVSSLQVFLTDRGVLSVPRIEASLRLGARGIELVQIAIRGGQVTARREQDGSLGDGRSKGEVLVQGIHGEVRPGSSGRYLVELSGRTPTGVRISLEGDAWLGLATGGDAVGVLSTRLDGEALGGRIRIEGQLRWRPRLTYDLSLVLADGSSKELASLAGLPGLSLLGTVDLDSRLTGDRNRALLEGSAVLGETKAFAEVACLPLELHLGSLAGSFALSPQEIRLGPFEGGLADRRLALEFQADPRDPDGSWRLRLEARDLDAEELLARYLVRPDRVSGRLGANLLVSGRGKDQDGFVASGSLRGEGSITELGVLGDLAAEYHLRELHDIDIEELAAQVFVHSGRILLRDMRMRSSLGDARGELEIGIAGCTLEGTAELALNRKVLGGGRRFLSLFEGGPRYNVGLTLGGTVRAPTLVYATR